MYDTSGQGTGVWMQSRCLDPETQTNKHAGLQETFSGTEMAQCEDRNGRAQSKRFNPHQSKMKVLGAKSMHQHI